MPSRDTKSEFIDLLDALCEDRLTNEQAVRLERIVLRDRAARKLYLDYMALHGTLLWDAARGDVAAFAEEPEPRTVPRVRPLVATAPPPDRRRARGAWVLTVAGVACLTAIGMIGWWLRPAESSAVRVADQRPVPVESDENGPERDGAHYRPVALGERAAPVPDLAQPSAPTAGEEPVVPPGDVVAFLDNQIARGWADAGVEPSAGASDAEWLRRVSLDLAGHIPTPAEVETFLADPSPGKRLGTVDRLLTGPDFDLHFATVWTNLLVGRAEPKLGNRGALLEFLRLSFAKERPWSETVAAFVAAEGAVDAEPAANFLVAHLNNQAVPATAITARVFLGTQVQCMQCHNHPFNDWTQQDFWELNSFFQGTELTRDERNQPTLVSYSTDEPTLFETRTGLMKAAYPKYDGREVGYDAKVSRRTQLAELLAEGEETQIADAFVNRTWAHLLGAGFTNPIDDMGPHNPPSHPEALDRLSRAFVASGYDVRQLVRWITSTRAYGLSSRFGPKNVDDDPEGGETPLFSRVYAKPMTAEQVYDSLLVATRSERPSDGRIAARDEWVRQFVRAYETDENDESVDFHGSVPQALAMMNGETVRDGLAVEPGTTLHAALASAGDETVKLRKLAVAALSRPLEPKESAALRRLVRASVNAAPASQRPQAYAEALQDAFWAMLNSGEFATVP